MLFTALKTLSIWLGILVLAILNGGFRELVLIPQLGRVTGFIFSGILLSVIIFAVAYVSMPWYGAQKLATYIIIGLSWLCLTVIFEFTVGHFVQGKSWSELLSAYTFQGGNLWPIVLVVIVIAPLAVAKMRGYA